MTDTAAPGGGAEEPADSVHALAERLRGLAEQLRDPELPDERAAELAREAAELVSQAGNEIDRNLRQGEAEPR
ncbi:MAG TPA: hypothetical protein VHJ54_06785 [Solirubrobacterales bacterium]|jgi:hypothetical protein|nr:hypothetical protein [Solirubrobacterales bacterium]